MEPSEIDLLTRRTEGGPIPATKTTESRIGSDSSAPILGPDVFASRKLLSPFIPQSDPENKLARTFGTWHARLDVLLIQACIISGLVLILNVVGTFLFNMNSENLEIFHGDCGTSAKIDSGLHVLINILSTLLLSASNLSMQLLAAPTRTEVDVAHQTQNWLDIGIPSFRNLKHIAKGRRRLWWTLALSSMPLHFLYNAAILSTLPLNGATLFVVTPDFLSGGTVDVNATMATVTERLSMGAEGALQLSPGKIVNTTLGASWGVASWVIQPGIENATWIHQVQEKMAAGVFSKRLSAIECLMTYQSPTGNRSDVIMVSTYDTIMEVDPRVLSNNSFLFVWGMYGFGGPGNYWACGPSNSFDCRKPDLWKANPSIVQDWNVYGYKQVTQHWHVRYTQLTNFQNRIDYCLSSETNLNKMCSVEFSLPIMIMICIVNATKCASIVLTAVYLIRNSHEPLITIGDAIKSYLKQPELQTAHMCLASRNQIPEQVIEGQVQKLFCSRRVGSKRVPQRQLQPTLRRYKMDYPLWFKAASRRSWILTLLGSHILLLAGIGFLGETLSQTRFTTGSTSKSLSFGFGSVHAETQGRMGALWNASYAVAFFCYVMFANVWQFLASTIHFQYNSLLTTLLANLEWQNYGFKKRSLRVSSPVGLQRSAFFISLPWRYGLPQMIVVSFLHWTLSQSVFVVPVESYSSDGSLSERFNTMGYSVWPIITSIITGTLMIATIVGLGFRRYTGGMPLNATCSIIISAACHRPDEDTEAHLFPVQWGAVSQPRLQNSTQFPKLALATDGEDAITVTGKDNTNSGRRKADEFMVLRAIGTGSGGQGNRHSTCEVLALDKIDKEDQGIVPGHCCFTTSRNIDTPKAGLLYD